MDVLSVIRYAAAAGGVAAAVAGALSRAWRYPALVVAAACFAVAGLLGILSVGLLFILLAVGCMAFAVRTSESAA